MSLKDDFLEALRSVKRDFLKDYEPEGPAREAAPPEPAPEPAAAQPFYAAEAPPSIRGERVFDEEIQSMLHEGNSMRDVFRPELHTPAEPEPMNEPKASEAEPAFPEPGESFAASPESTLPGQAPDFGDGEERYGEEGAEPPGGRFIMDQFGNGDEGDGRTIISRNTIIRGAIQTDDSMRLFGQVLGDIDCRSNILVAGKVRGNTSAANAYVINAQVDGNLLCDDVINVTDDAWILGNIRAQQADIDGKIKGNIEIRHSISIGSNSSVIGNISTDELEIRRGAFVNGQIMMYSPSRDVIDRFDRFDQ